jgi:vesicle-fusing ATPase
LDRDEASAWIRWMKSSPTPLFVDLSGDLRKLANSTISDANFDLIQYGREEFVSRLGCRIILLPSGTSLSSPLLEPPASMIYGKLLYGGMTRYRRLISSNSRRPPRKAGERTDIKVTAADNIPAWIQYGGAERMYEAVDMGPAAVFEMILLPRGQSFPEKTTGADMVVHNLLWKPQDIFGIIEDTNANSNTPAITDQIDFVKGYTPMSQSGKNRNDAFESDFKTSVGGLQKQIDAIVRRVLDGRVLRPVQEDDNAVKQDETATALAAAALEAEELGVLGLTPVRGLLLYGPPGTGKTLLARQISRALRARTPKIVSAPELLDRWVGGSEKLVRGLFAEAEAELAAYNGDATKSALHVVVIDEIDAVFRRRSAGEDSGETTRASVVNQILAKLDGINQISNILVIGMTNRRELLDEALLRPGRLEVQVEVPLPDQDGRREILQIHFDALRKKGRLSRPLCCAIDGVPYMSSRSRDEALLISSNESSDITDERRQRKRDAFKRVVGRTWSEVSSAVRPAYDLSADSITGGFSGADIAGLVRCAGSLALSRARKDGNGVDGLLITFEDVKQALQEVKP